MSLCGLGLIAVYRATGSGGDSVVISEAERDQPSPAEPVGPTGPTGMDDMTMGMVPPPPDETVVDPAPTYRRHPRSALQVACMAANGFDLAAYQRRIEAERPEGRTPPPGWHEPTEEERVAATAAVRACRRFDALDPSAGEWLGCLEGYGVVMTYMIPFRTRTPEVEQIWAAGANCRAVRPANRTPHDALGQCIDERSLYGLPVADPVQTYPECVHLLAPPPPDPSAWETCVADGGFPPHGTARWRPADIEAARAVAARCAPLLPPGWPMPVFPCLAEHGVHLALLSADAWPPEELRAAQEACGVQMPPVRPDFQRWLICLADNGAEAAGGLGPWHQAVPLEVARQAVMACEAPAAGSGPPSIASPGSPWEPYERCQHERGPRNYPGAVLAADLRRVAQSCAPLWPQPAPRPLTPWRACLEEHGLKSPYAPAASELEAAAAALDACAAIEEPPNHA